MITSYRIALLSMLGALFTLVALSPMMGGRDVFASSDRDVLVALYDATDGLNWNKNANWLSSAPLGQWHGVNTDDSGRVVGLKLGGNRLSGGIPEELGQLSELRELRLSGNRLSGEIPEELGALSNLETLVLAGNQLEGGIPLALGSLASLEHLFLNGNDLEGDIPKELGSLSNLKRLFLKNNSFSGCVPTALRDVPTTDFAELGLPFCDIAADWHALVALYKATNGNNWENNQKWGSLRPLGEWYGVTTGEDGRVTHLNLVGNDLSGSIPAKLRDLTNLEVLELSRNELEGRIPDTLGNLPNLEGLKLSFNRLTGEIPEGLGDLSNLEELELDSNSLFGEIPEELGGLAGLEKLLLNDNGLFGEIPEELGNLSNLERLQLGNNWFIGCIPAALQNVPDNDLSTLGLSACDSGIPPDLDPADLDRNVLIEFYYLTGGDDWRYNTNWKTDAPIGEWLGVVTDEEGRVKSLNLNFNLLRGPLPARLAELTKLEKLGLYHNYLTGEIPPQLGDLTELDFLRLGNNLLTGPIPIELGDLTNLEYLDLAGNQLSGPIPSQLGSLTNLEVLSLSWNQLDGPIPGELGNLTKLVELDMVRNRLTGEIPSQLGDLDHLTHVFFLGNELTGCIPAGLSDVMYNDFPQCLLEDGLPFCSAQPVSGEVDTGGPSGEGEEADSPPQADPSASAYIVNCKPQGADSAVSGCVGALTEENLNGARLRVQLEEDVYDASLDAGDFTLVTSVPGLNVESVEIKADRRAEVVLAYDGADFDEDLTIAVKVGADALEGDTALTTGEVSVGAVVEDEGDKGGPSDEGEEADSPPQADPSASAYIVNCKPEGADSAVSGCANALTEGNLNGAKLRVQLEDDAYAASLDAGDFTLVTNVPGLSVESVKRNANRRAEVVLAYNGADFDEDLTIAVTVLADALEGDTALTTGGATVEAVVE